MATVDELLAENRDDILPIIVSAIEQDRDIEWLAGYVMDENFESMVRGAIAILPIRKIIDKLLKAATDDEKKVLTSEKAPKYLGSVQDFLIDWQKRLKEELRAAVEAQKQSAEQPSPPTDGAAQPGASSSTPAGGPPSPTPAPSSSPSPTPAAVGTGKQKS